MMLLVMMRLYHDTVDGGCVGVVVEEMMWSNEKPILISIML